MYLKANIISTITTTARIPLLAKKGVNTDRTSPDVSDASADAFVSAHA